MNLAWVFQIVAMIGAFIIGMMFARLAFRHAVMKILGEAERHRREAEEHLMKAREMVTVPNGADHDDARYNA